MGMGDVGCGRGWGGRVVAGVNYPMHCPPEGQASVVVAFRCDGEPKTQGSKTMGVTKSGRRFMREDGGVPLKRWRKSVSDAASLYMRDKSPEPGPLALDLTFYLRPPKAYRKLPHVRPDLDKLARAVGDALTGIVYKDDGQITTLRLRKVYARVGSPGVWVTVTRVDAAGAD